MLIKISLDWIWFFFFLLSQPLLIFWLHELKVEFIISIERWNVFFFLCQPDKGQVCRICIETWKSTRFFFRLIWWRLYSHIFHSYKLRHCHTFNHIEWIIISILMNNKRMGWVWFCVSLHVTVRCRLLEHFSATTKCLWKNSAPARHCNQKNYIGINWCRWKVRVVLQQQQKNKKST